MADSRTTLIFFDGIQLDYPAEGTKDRELNRTANTGYEQETDGNLTKNLLKSGGWFQEFPLFFDVHHSLLFPATKRGNRNPFFACISNTVIDFHGEFLSHVSRHRRYFGICFPLPSFLHYLASSNILKPFSSPFEAFYPPGINHETIPKCPSRSLNIQEFRKKTRQKTIPKSVLPP